MQLESAFLPYDIVLGIGLAFGNNIEQIIAPSVETAWVAFVAYFLEVLVIEILYGYTVVDLRNARLRGGRCEGSNRADLNILKN